MHVRTFYEFFAGGGMARAGLGEGWRCLFANDFDPKKGAAYEANWGGEHLYVGDVAGVASFELSDHADLVWASFPCQDLSLAGPGTGLKGERSGAFWPFWNLMRGLRREGRAPRVIVLENVCGLLSSHGGEDFTALCRAVGNDGYRFGAMVIDAKWFLPQSRPRLFIIAVRDDLEPPPSVIAPQSSRHWHPARLIEAKSRLPLPLLSRWIWFDAAPPARRNSALADVIEHVPDPLWRSDRETAELLEMMSAVNRAKVAAALAKGERLVGTAYRRTRVENGVKAQRVEIRFDGVAGCLRTPGGGSSRQTVVLVENGRVRSRLMTPRETARLMGLPDGYALPPRANDAYHLTGDGVAVPVVRFLADRILEPLTAGSCDMRTIAA